MRSHVLKYNISTFFENFIHHGDIVLVFCPYFSPFTLILPLATENMCTKFYDTSLISSVDIFAVLDVKQDKARIY